MEQQLTSQIAILGGGIAGLWLLAELKSAGYDVLLCEKYALGEGQTIASQGIIHGGTKYALQGNISSSGIKISDMPRIWHECLMGKRSPDLHRVQQLSEHQFLWSNEQLGGRLSSFFASKVMSSRMDKLSKSQFPVVFQHPEFRGSVYQLDEPVLNIPSLLTQFQQQFSTQLIHTPEISLKQDKQHRYYIVAKTINNKILKIHAEHIICTAGEGNEQLIQTIIPKNTTTIAKMQRRPLQMVLARGKLPLLFAHALGVSTLPKITISSHKDQQNRTIWYIGGQPAEQGVDLTAMDLIRQTRKQLEKQLAWIDFNQTQWSTWQVNRAEGQQHANKRPYKPICKNRHNLTIAWPTKLAFAPLLTEMIKKRLEQMKIQPSLEPITKRIEQPTPAVATPIWDRKDLLWN